MESVPVLIFEVKQKERNMNVYVIKHASCQILVRFYLLVW